MYSEYKLKYDLALIFYKIYEKGSHSQIRSTDSVSKNGVHTELTCSGAPYSEYGVLHIAGIGFACLKKYECARNFIQQKRQHHDNKLVCSFPHVVIYLYDFCCIPLQLKFF